MERRVITVLLHTAFVVSLLYGCYVFHRAQIYNPQVFMNFVPAGILFLVNVVLNAVWEAIGGRGLTFLSDMDPLTLFFLLVASVLMLFALFMEDERFNQVFGWAFSLATFVAGFEAGKLRQRATQKRNEQAQALDNP